MTESRGTEGSRTPVANSFAERWIGTLRRELLDHTITWNQRQLERLWSTTSTTTTGTALTGRLSNEHRSRRL